MARPERRSAYLPPSTVLLPLRRESCLAPASPAPGHLLAPFLWVLSQALRLLPQQKQAPGTAPDPSGCRPPSWPDGWAAAASSSVGAGSSGESLSFLLSPPQGMATVVGT